MNTNMGKFDRGGRLVIALALFGLAFGTAALGEGAVFWIVTLVASVFTLTAIVGNCPLYSLVGLKTCRDC